MVGRDGVGCADVVIETREGGVSGWTGGGECLFVVSGFYGCVDMLEKRGGRDKVWTGCWIQTDFRRRNKRQKKTT